MIRLDAPVLEALLDALVPQDVLIVLDNCEHLIGACATTAEAILRRCPRVHLVATSREPLGIGGEVVYRVPSLSLPGPGDSGSSAIESSDAIALFTDRARTQGVGLSVDEETGPLVVSVCRRLDGMPLAIELAAARLRSMSLTELGDRLDQRFRLLTGGSRTALERQQTLRAAVGWSYSLLNNAEQVLLACLSVFAEGFGLDAAEAVCGSGDIDAAEVAGLLGSLVDKSLVVAAPAGASLRCRLLETIRLFAAERLVKAGDEEAAAVAAAHCAYFLAVAEAAAAHLTGAEQGRWLARLDADQANLRRAAQHAAGGPDGTALVLRLGVALFALLDSALTAARKPSSCSGRRWSGPTPRRPGVVRGGADHRPVAALFTDIAGRHAALRNRGLRPPAAWRRPASHRVLQDPVPAYYFTGDRRRTTPRPGVCPARPAARRRCRAGQKPLDYLLTLPSH